MAFGDTVQVGWENKTRYQHTFFGIKPHLEQCDSGMRDLMYAHTYLTTANLWEQMTREVTGRRERKATRDQEISTNPIK